MSDYLMFVSSANTKGGLILAPPLHYKCMVKYCVAFVWKIGFSQQLYFNRRSEYTLMPTVLMIYYPTTKSMLIWFHCFGVYSVCVYLRLIKGIRSRINRKTIVYYVYSHIWQCEFSKRIRHTITVNYHNYWCLFVLVCCCCCCSFSLFSKVC